MKDEYYQRIIAIIAVPQVSTGSSDRVEETPHPSKIINVYVESIRAALYQTIDRGDGVQIG